MILSTDVWAAALIRRAELSGGFGVVARKGDARAGAVLQIVMLVSIILPLSVGAVVKAFAWQIVLRRDGIVYQTLVGLGLWDEPQRLLFTETGLVLGAANIFLPFMILPIYSVVKLIDPRLSEAGATLGATPLYRFTHVTLPLTLPGIAGLVLTAGLAVDANVLIYERVREEKALGRSPFSALATGYEKAMSAIIDANLTTLIAGVLLFGFGSGPIRGFATTLTLGIITSMFSSTIFTRMLLAVWVRWRRPAELVI